MTTKAEKIKQRDALVSEIHEKQKQCALLRDEIKSMPDDKPVRRKPWYGQHYYFNDSEGDTLNSLWDDDEFEVQRWENLNYFPTYEAAKKANRMERTMRHLRLLNGGWVPEIAETRVIISLYADKISFTVPTYTLFGIPPFPTVEAARAAVEEVGEANVIELLRGGA